MIFNNSKFNSVWPIKGLSELGTFKRGKSKHRPRNDIKLFQDGKFPLVQTGEIKSANIFITTHNATYNEFGLSQSKLWPKNTLCITIAANIAETALLNYPMCFPDSVVGFNANKEECSEIYMHYIFSYIRASIQSRISGSIQDNINIEYLTGLSFRIPQKQERLHIESILFSLDSKIELNNRINTELEGMAKLIYEYWFVQFDFPYDFAQNKPADETSKPQDIKPYKSSGGKMVWNKELKREIPEGWEVYELTKEMNLQYGFPFSTTLFNEKDKGIGVIRIRDILNNSISCFSTESVDIKYKLEKGDLLVGMDGNFHMNFWEKENCYLNQRSLRIRKKKSSRLSNLNILFQIEPYIKAREKNVSRTTVAHLSAKDINRLNVIVPDESLVKPQMMLFDELLEKILNNRNQNQQLSSLRDWLLPMLMNGQVRVK